MDEGSETVCVELGSGYVVGEVADSSGGSSEVFEEAVDGFGGPLLLPGWSKNARMSSWRRVIVVPANAALVGRSGRCCGGW